MAHQRKCTNRPECPPAAMVSSVGAATRQRRRGPEHGEAIVNRSWVLLMVLCLVCAGCFEGEEGPVGPQGPAGGQGPPGAPCDVAYYDTTLTTNPMVLSVPELAQEPKPIVQILYRHDSNPEGQWREIETDIWGTWVVDYELAEVTIYLRDGWRVLVIVITPPS